MILDSQHWNRIYDQSPVGIAIVGLDGSWLKVNKSLCKYLKYTELELLDKTFQDITHPEDLKPDLEMLRKVELGEIDGYEMLKRYLTKTGESIWSVLTVGVIKDDDNKPVHYVSHIRPALIPQKIINETINGSDVKTFVLDNWQWFVGTIITAIGIITTLSVMLYKSEAKIDIIEQKLDRWEQIIDNRDGEN